MECELDEWREEWEKVFCFCGEGRIAVRVFRKGGRERTIVVRLNARTGHDTTWHMGAGVAQKNEEAEIFWLHVKKNKISN